MNERYLDMHRMKSNSFSLPPYVTVLSHSPSVPSCEIVVGKSIRSFRHGKPRIFYNFIISHYNSWTRSNLKASSWRCSQLMYFCILSYNMYHRCFSNRISIESEWKKTFKIDLESGLAGKRAVTCYFCSYTGRRSIRQHNSVSVTLLVIIHSFNDISAAFTIRTSVRRIEMSKLFVRNRTKTSSPTVISCMHLD